eukprot:450379_1
MKFIPSIIASKRRCTDFKSVANKPAGEKQQELSLRRLLNHHQRKKMKKHKKWMRKMRKYDSKYNTLYKKYQHKDFNNGTNTKCHQQKDSNNIQHHAQLQECRFTYNYPFTALAHHKKSKLKQKQLKKRSKLLKWRRKQPKVGHISWEAIQSKEHITIKHSVVYLFIFVCFVYKTPMGCTSCM